MQKIKSVLLTLAVLPCTITSASRAADKPLVAIQHSVEARVVFRPWNTKGFGEQIGTERLIVITSPEERGDIVVLRKNEMSGGFTAEVYQQDAVSVKSNVWHLQSPEGSKSIVKQHDGSFFLSELIGGQEGGSRKEIFKLSDPAT